MKGLFYVLLLTLFLQSVNAQFIEFPDSNFKAELIKDGIDLNNDSQINIEEAEAVTSLSLWNEIHSLEDI